MYVDFNIGRVLSNYHEIIKLLFGDVIVIVDFAFVFVPASAFL